MSRLDIGVHTGTHVDAPLHFFADGAGTQTLPLEPFVGRAYVADGTMLTGPIDDAALERCGIPDGAERVLLKTKNGELWSRDDFTRDFIRLDGAGAQWVVDRCVRLVAIDYLSIGDGTAHKILLDRGVVAVEGLDLRAVDPGWCDLICLPLSLVGSDGSPARAILRTL